MTHQLCLLSKYTDKGDAYKYIPGHLPFVLPLKVVDERAIFYTAKEQSADKRLYIIAPHSASLHIG